MPRMVFWNVEHFSGDKFFRRRRKRTRDGEEAWGTNAAQDYLDVLVNAVTANAPDFIVIVEARPAGQLAEGTLLPDDGTMQLLNYLRLNDDVQWSLVPPVISGTGRRGEGIAIFWRRTPQLFLTGPWRWPGGAGPAAAGVAAANYPAPYNTAIPNGNPARRTPAHAENLYNPGAYERQLAGQWRFRDARGAVLSFGGAGTRSPFRATFYHSVLRQNYAIVACHTAPEQDGGLAGIAAAPSTLATQAVSQLAEVTAIGARETVVVAGDFNVSLFDAAATGVAYANFGAVGFAQVIRQTAGHAMPATYPSKGYLVTHMRPVVRASPDWTDGYPAFGYGTIRGRVPRRRGWVHYDSIDNGFVRGGALANATIANIVTGAPYTAAVPAPADVPTGALPYLSALNDPLSINVPHGYNPDDDNYWDDDVELFQDIDNYARVRGVSDHLPLVFDF